MVEAPSSTSSGATTPEAARPKQLPTGETPTSINPQSLRLPNAEGSITGMGESFAPVLSSGTATFSVPIAVPPGRHGVQPSLALGYASTNGNGIAGIGWNVSVPFIARQTDHGAARYDDRSRWHRGEDRFLYNGGQELVPVENDPMASVDSGRIYGGWPGFVPADVWIGQWQQYRAKIEGGFMRFFRTSDGKRWKVYAPDGTIFEFGLLPENEVPTDYPRFAALESEFPNGEGRIFAWHLARVTDAHGSQIYYTYSEDQGARYLSDIFYVSPASCGGNGPAATRTCRSPLSEYGVRIQLAYESRRDAFTSYRPGWAVTVARRLRRITMTAADGAGTGRALVRRYLLGYDTTSFHSLLTSVQLEGRPSAANPSQGGAHTYGRVPEANIPASDASIGLRLPVMSFEYSRMPSSGAVAPGFGGLDATVHAAVSSPPVGLDAPQVELVDVNGDGLLDVLHTSPGRYRTTSGLPAVGVFWNGFTGNDAQPADRGATFSAPIPIALDASTSDLFRFSNPNLLGMDVDGDGRGDWMHVPPTLGHGWFTPARTKSSPEWSPARQGWTFAHAYRPLDAANDPRIDLTRDGAFFRVMDVNGDGLVDVVRTTGTSMKTWLNLGWIEGGEGRFGHAELVRGDWVISPEPLEACLPHDGQPLDFGSSEVRIAEMNGDGYPDIVHLRAGRLTYFPGRGGASFGVGASSCAPGFATGRHVEVTNAPRDIAVDLAGVYLEDVDGDGADDLVQVRYQALDVWFNQAGSSFTNRISIATPYAPSFAPNIRFGDLDGSGTTDLVVGRAGNWQYVDLLGGKRPRLLVRVHNGLGATTALEYASSVEDYLRDLREARQCSGPSCAAFTWDAVRGDTCDGPIERYAGRCVYRSGNSPVISNVVRRVQTTDNFSMDTVGQPATVLTQEFAYHDGYYEGIEREFRGFGAADVRVPGETASLDTYTRTWFHQGRRPNDIATDRLAHSPIEAAKGNVYRTETWSGAGVYLASSHSTVTVRRLAVGLDGRPIAFAFTSQTDSLAYDTTTFTANDATLSLPGLVQETCDETGSVGATASTVEQAILPIRGGRYVWTRSTSDVVDNLGHVLQATAHGRLHDIHDGPSAAPRTYGEEIVTHAEYGRVAENTHGWIWRPMRSYASGHGDPTALGDTRFAYSETGDPTSSTQVVDPPTTLDFLGDGSSPDHVLTSQTLVASTRYDAWGNVLASCAGAQLAADGSNSTSCLRYAESDFDPTFQQFPTSERIAVELDGASGFRMLASSGTWDPGFGAVLSVTDPNGQTTTVGYDGLGRLTYARPPRNETCFGNDPPTVITYHVRETSLPLSWAETRVDGRDTTQGCAAPRVSTARAYVDGLGRARATFTFSPAERANAWIRSGVTRLDAKARPIAGYDPHFVAGDATGPSGMLLAWPNPAEAPFVGARYDAFDRAVVVYAQDGAATHTELHATETRVYDPNDLATGQGRAHFLDTPSITRVDGHGRPIDQVEILRQPVGGATQALHLVTTYRADGRPIRVTRAEMGTREVYSSTSVVGDHAITREFVYDTAGRRLASTDRDTDSPSRPESSRHWRYLFNRVGDLVAVRDPRGCGQDFYYDRAGRMLGEDYVGCAEAQQGGDEAVDVLPSGAIGLEATAAPVAVDARTFYDALPSWGAGLVSSSAYYLGRVSGTIDRAQRSVVSYDAAGNAVHAARQMALIPEASTLPASLAGDRPGIVGADATLSSPPIYDTAHTYAVDTQYDALGRAWSNRLPQDPDWARFGGTGSAPIVQGFLDLNTRGLPRATWAVIDGGRHPIARSLEYDALGAPTVARFMEPSGAGPDDGIVQTLTYDAVHRPILARLVRSPNSGVSGTPGTLNAITVPFAEEYGWDAASNLVSVRSLAGPGAFPAGHRQVLRRIEHDSLYRVAQVSYDYRQDDLSWSPTDISTDWRDERTRNNADGTSHGEADPMRRRPAPMLPSRPDGRVVDLTYEYDWLANMVEWQDDASSFHERSLGDLVNGTASGGLRPSALYLATSVPSASHALEAGTDRGGWLELSYGEGGNVETVTVRAQCHDAGPQVCYVDRSANPATQAMQLAARCSCANEQHYQYRWDEVNRLAEARRYDRQGSGDWTLAARQRYRYDASNTRLVKQTLDPVPVNGAPSERIHLSPYPGDFERSGVRVDRAAGTYVGDTVLGTETQYLVAGARLVWKPSADGALFDREHRLTYAFSDLIQSTSVVVDLDSGALLEQTTFYPNGVRETHRTTDAESYQLELNGFTGKEADEEVGLVYFGQRHLMPHLGRWASPDPLAVHAMGGGEAMNAFHYVAGNLLQGRDPSGLDPRPEASPNQPGRPAGVGSYAPAGGAALSDQCSVCNLEGDTPPGDAAPGDAATGSTGGDSAPGQPAVERSLVAEALDVATVANDQFADPHAVRPEPNASRWSSRFGLCQGPCPYAGLGLFLVGVSIAGSVALPGLTGAVEGRLAGAAERQAAAQTAAKIEHLAEGPNLGNVATQLDAAAAEPLGSAVAAAPGASVTIGGTNATELAGRLSPEEMAALQIEHGTEFAQIYLTGPGRNGGGGTYYLLQGSADRVDIPMGHNVRLINHTHPLTLDGKVVPLTASTADQDVLRRLQFLGSPQRSSQVVPAVGQPFRFNTTHTHGIGQ